ncbi:MAG: sugar-binding domain-containing protein [Planctomycetia bacterium]|jgi:DNA-binding transcriptional regulator LsrR (DeoR family)
MRRISDDDLLITVAKMYYEEGKHQVEIAKTLDMSQAKVSRMLTRARERGIIRISVARFNPRAEELEEQLKTRFGLNLVVVVKTSSRAPVKQVRGIVGHVAGSIIAERLREAELIGITGGRTLRQLVNSIELDPSYPLEVVQLMGNVNTAATPVDAIELGRKLTVRNEGMFHMLNTPAIVSDSETCRLFSEQPQIRKVLQLYDKVDLALVGIGLLDESILFDQNVVSRKDISYLRDAGAVGEICGRFYDETGKECQTKFRDQVISIDLEKLKTVKETIGVVVGSGRERAIHSAIRSGLVTSLVVDQQGAQAILALDEKISKP